MSLPRGWALTGLDGTSTEIADRVLPEPRPTEEFDASEEQVTGDAGEITHLEATLPGTEGLHVFLVPGEDAVWGLTLYSAQDYFYTGPTGTRIARSFVPTPGA